MEQIREGMSAGNQTVEMLPEMMFEMVFTFDREGRILTCNKASRDELGYGAEMTGLSAAEIFPSEKALFQDPFRDYKPEAQKKIEIPEMMVYRKNRTCFPVFLRIMQFEEGVTAVTALNMGAVRSLEKELLFVKSDAEATLQVRNEFIANVTHELRTPVNGVKGHTAVLLAENPPAEQRKALEIIQRCCEDMGAIINNILDFSKLQAGKFQLAETRFDLYEMLDHVIATNIAVINEKGLRIILNISENVPQYVFGDDLRLTQILNNLISNGVKFTDVGFLSVDVTKHMQYGDEVELFFIVRDSGIGISPEDKDRLFQSFSQIDASATRKHGGTGLGLVITRDLVELMGGSIRVESQKGKGSNFSFTVRLKTEEPEDNDRNASQMSDKTDKNEKILNFLDMSDLNDLNKQQEVESVYHFGSEENCNEIERKTEKLILALELGAWEKAELTASGLKKLLEGGPEDLRKTLFRLEMVIRKEDVTGSRDRFEKLKEKLQESLFVAEDD